MTAERSAPRPAPHDTADLQRLIRYVERWRLSHFQRADGSQSDSRLTDADDLLRKLRAGLQMASSGGHAVLNGGSGVYLY